MKKRSPRNEGDDDSQGQEAAPDTPKTSETTPTSSSTSTPTDIDSPSMLVSGSVSETTLSGLEGVQHSSSTSSSTDSDSSLRKDNDKSSIQAVINFRAHMTHEQADKWAKDTAKWLRVQNGMSIDDERLQVTIKSCVEPASGIRGKSVCFHENAVETPKGIDYPQWCPDCRMHLVEQHG